MRKQTYTILTLLISLLLSATAEAQVKFGLRLGANVSKASISKRLFSTDDRDGFFFGPTLDIKIPYLGFGTDLSVQYNNKKVQLDAEDGTGLNSGVSHIQTIEIPLNIKFTVGNDKVFSVYGAMGPQVSWNIGGKSLKAIFDTSQYTMRSSMFSWNLGAGFTFIGKLRLSYNYNIQIGETAEINFINDVGDAIHGHLRTNQNQFFLTYFF